MHSEISPGCYRESSYSYLILGKLYYLILGNKNKMIHGGTRVMFSNAAWYMSMRWNLCHKQKKLFKLRSLISWSNMLELRNISTAFAWYKSIAISTHEIVVHRLVVHTNKQLRSS